MAKAFIPVYVCEESLLIQEIWAAYRACLAKAYRGLGMVNKSFTRPTEHFLGGAPIWTSSASR